MKYQETIIGGVSYEIQEGESIWTPKPSCFQESSESARNAVFICVCGGNEFLVRWPRDYCTEVECTECGTRNVVHE